MKGIGINSYFDFYQTTIGNVQEAFWNSYMHVQTIYLIGRMVFQGPPDAGSDALVGGCDKIKPF